MQQHCCHTARMKCGNGNYFPGTCRATKPKTREGDPQPSAHHPNLIFPSSYPFALFFRAYFFNLHTPVDSIAGAWGDPFLKLAMKDKIVFITGAARGIGFEIGRAFAGQGATVVLSDLDTDELSHAITGLGNHHSNSFGITCDVTQEASIKHALDQTLEKYGRIDVLINNAGLQHVAPIEEFPVEKFEHLIKVMLVGPFMAIQHILPTMKKQNFGRIINMASINGLIGFANKAAYNSAKHGLVGLTKVAALEAAHYNITVNALCPGYVDTALVRNQLAELAKTRNVELEKVLEEVIYPLVPQKRLLEVQEIADYAIFLAGDKAKGITGQAVVIDGGYTVQ